MFGRLKYERADVGYLNTLCLQSIRFLKNHAQRYDLVPNKYGVGSEVIVDMYEGKISFIADPASSKKGVSAEGDLINGSRYFTIPPGESKLEIHSSPFVDVAPDVTVEWEEAWL